MDIYVKKKQANRGNKKGQSIMIQDGTITTRIALSLFVLEAEIIKTS